MEEKSFKHWLKKKVRVTMAVMIGFLISGSIGYASEVTFETTNNKWEIKGKEVSKKSDPNKIKTDSEKLNIKFSDAFNVNKKNDKNNEVEIGLRYLSVNNDGYDNLKLYGEYLKKLDEYKKDNSTNGDKEKKKKELEALKKKIEDDMLINPIGNLKEVKPEYADIAKEIKGFDLNNLDESKIKKAIDENEKRIKESNYYGDQAKGEHALAFGFRAKAIGKNSIALGTNADAANIRSIVIGTNSKSEGQKAIIIGSDSKISNGANDTLAIGRNIEISGNTSLAIGTSSKVKSENSVVIGNEAEVDTGSGQSLSLGHRTKVKSSQALGLGNDVVVEKDSRGAVAIGSDDSGYNVNGENKGLNAAGNTPKSSFTATRAKGAATTAIGAHAQAMSSAATALGARAFALSKHSTSIGFSALVAEKSDESVAIGFLTSVEGKNSVAIGRKAKVTNNSEGAIAIGTDDTSYRSKGRENGDDSYPATLASGLATTAVGAHAQAKKEAASAYGARAFAYEKESAAFGANSRAKVEGGVAIGSYALANRDTKNVKYYDFINNIESADKSKENGKENTSYKLATKSALSIGNTTKGFTRQLIGLAAGSDDTDAVNVWQLKQLRDYMVSTQPFEYTDEEGKPVAVIKDEKGNIKYYKLGNNNKPDSSKEVTVDKLKVKAKGDKPKTLDNIDSGLGFTSNDETNEDTINNVLNGTTKNNKAVNVADLSKVANGLVKKGLNFTGDDENTVVNRNLGDTLKIKGGATNLTDNNIGVVADKDKGTLNVKLSSKLSNLTEIKFSGDGAPTLSSTGINMGNQKITQVLDGTENGDAVNFKQLKESLNDVLKKANEVSKITVTRNSPMMFAKKDKDGNLTPIIKANDGKFYNPSDIESNGSAKKDAHEVKIGNDEEIVIKTIDPHGTDPSKDMKLTKVAKGDISTNSTDAINGGQLSKILGVDGTNYKVDKDGKVVKADNKSIYSHVNYNGNESKKTPNGLIDATNELITAVNKGYVIKVDDDTTKTKYLGDTISVIHGEDNKETGFAGKNIKTYLTDNGDIALLFSETPTFKSVTIEKAPIKDTDATNKKYVDGELNIIKSELGNNVTKLKELSDNSPFEYEYTNENGEKLKPIEKDGTTKYYKESDVENGKVKDEAQAVEDNKVKKSIKAKDDPKQINNIASGLGLEEANDGKVKEKLDNLLGNSTSTVEPDILNKVATIRDLQALGQLGMIFVGNDEKEVHRNLGQTLNIKGVGIEKEKISEFKSSEGNILVKENKEKDADGLEISLSKRLKDLEEAVFEKKDGEEVKSTTTINGDGITLKNKGNENVIEIKNNDGKGEINFKKDNDKGTGKITGLADLDDSSTGDMAANKNYVDKKISELDNNNPFAYEDKQGNKLVKGKDGKLYNPADIKDKNYEEGKGYTDNKGTKVEPKENSDVVLTAQPKDKGPIQLGNINSGIFKENKKAKDDATEDEKKKIDEENKKAESEAIEKVLKGENTDKTVVNAQDLSKISKAIMDKGLTFKAKDGKEIHKNLGETLGFEGDNNIKVTSNDKIKVALNENIEVKSVKVGKSELKEDGLTFNGNKGKITGLADVKDDDPRDVAVNKGYVDDEIGKIGDKANLALGGVSNAVAMANLVQVTGNSTHRHNLSAAYGYYGGSHSLAIGFSGISKNNNFIYKLSGAVNNQGNLALGIGAGIMLGEKNDYKERKDNILLKQEIEEYKKKQVETDKKVKELEELVKKLMNK